MSKTKEVVPMSTDELLAAMRELIPAKDVVPTAPAVIDFTGVGAPDVLIVTSASKVDRAVVKAAMERIAEYEEAIRTAERTYRDGEYRALDRDWGLHNERVRDTRIESARRAIAEEYEALNLRLNVNARLREHGLID
jgi:hypothetical protein